MCAAKANRAQVMGDVVSVMIIGNGRSQAIN